MKPYRMTGTRLAAHQRGQAMLLTVVLMAVGISIIVYTLISPGRHTLEQDRTTAAALAQAKQALIGYAVGMRLDVSGETPRVGDLPCPDISAPGTPTEGEAGTSCSNGGGTTLGRLPWKTLGLPDLRDGSGERLWYAVSNSFKKNPAAAGFLNSDTNGTITVRDRDGLIVHDGTNPEPYVHSGAIAVVIAPGVVLRRADGVQQARETSAERTSPLNYLDIANVGGNESNSDFSDGTTNGFINGDVYSNGNLIVNDRVLAIKHDDLMPLAQRRVAGEVLKCLSAYSNANGGRYPWAASVASGGYSDEINTRFGRIPDPPMSESVLGIISAGQSTTINLFGFDIPVPVGLLTQNFCDATPALCMANSWPSSPACNFGNGTWWLHWKEQVFYGVADAYSPNLSITVGWPLPLVHLGGILPVSGCPSCLTVNPPSSSADKQVVVIVAGKKLAAPPLTSPPSPGQQRDTPTDRQSVANYLEDANTGASVDLYTKLPSSTTHNDTVVYR